MSPLARKRAQRHEELVAIAKDLLIQKGLSGLTVDGLAKASGYSRPTIYQHFRLKDEDKKDGTKPKHAILDTVARETLTISKELSIEAAKMDHVPPRERALVCVLAYEMLARFHPGDFHILEYLGYPWVLEELPDELRLAYREAITEFSLQLGSHIQAAVDAGDLKFEGRATTTELTFHSISLIYGSYTSIIKNRIYFQLAEAPDAWGAVRTALDALWDGFGWEPCSKDFNYRQRTMELLKEAYPQYWLKTKTAELAREVDNTTPEQ